MKKKAMMIANRMLCLMMLLLSVSSASLAATPSIAPQDVDKLTVLADDTPFFKTPGGKSLGRHAKGDQLIWAFTAEHDGTGWYAAWSPRYEEGYVRAQDVQANLFSPAPIAHPVQATLYYQPEGRALIRQTIGQGDALNALVARINQATSLPRDSVCVQGVAWLEIETMDGQVHRVEVAGDDCPMMAMGGQAFDLRTPQEMALARTQAGGGPYGDAWPVGAKMDLLRLMRDEGLPLLRDKAEEVLDTKIPPARQD